MMKVANYRRHSLQLKKPLQIRRLIKGCDGSNEISCSLDFYIKNSSDTIFPSFTW